MVDNGKELEKGGFDNKEAICILHFFEQKFIHYCKSKDEASIIEKRGEVSQLL